MENKNNMKEMMILTLAGITSFLGVYLGYITKAEDFYAIVFVLFITFAAIVYVMEKLIPKKKEEEDDESQ